MILNIETIKREQIILGLYDGKVLKCFEFVTKYQSEELLVAIEGILAKNKLSLKDLKAIFVNCGPGSFTGVRVGVTTANTLGWSLDIPVFGYRDGELEKALEQKITISKFLKSVLPFYN